MRFVNPSSRNSKGKGASIWLFCGAMAISAALAPQARAGFIGYYDIGNFTQTTTSDGFAYTPDLGLSVVVVGGNDGSGNYGTTDLVIQAPAAGMVQFNYLYNSLDTPGFDGAGYLLDGNFTPLADTNGQSGTLSFSVNSGDVFGFQVWTADNTGEPGIFTVSNFAAPAGGSSGVPEPRTLPMVLLAAIVAACRRMKRGRATSEENA
jgi:hypothetical protein